MQTKGFSKVFILVIILVAVVGVVLIWQKQVERVVPEPITENNKKENAVVEPTQNQKAEYPSNLSIEYIIYGNPEAGFDKKSVSVDNEGNVRVQIHYNNQVWEDIDETIKWSNEEMKELRLLVQEADVMEFDVNDYACKGVCPPELDGTTRVVSFMINGKSKRIATDSTYDTLPDELIAVYQKMSNVIRSY